MEAPVQRHNPDRLFLPRLRHDWLLAHRALGCKPPVEILDAVDLVGCVHREGNPIQGLATHDTGETLGVVWLARCPQDPIQDWGVAFAALLQGVHVVSLAQGFPFQGIEGFSLKWAHALGTVEAVDVVEAPHRRTTRSLTDNLLFAHETGAKEVLSLSLPTPAPMLLLLLLLL